MAANRRLNIMGSFGPAVSATSGTSNFINVAGGVESGDVYQETSPSPDLSFDDVRRALAELPVAQGTRIVLEKTIVAIETAVKSAAPNVGLVDLLLSGIVQVAPGVASLVAKIILGQSESASLTTLAVRILDLAKEHA